MGIKVSNTPDGVVVSEITRRGERCYRIGNNGLWACAGQGSWVRVPRTDVPQKIKNAYFDYCEQQDVQ